MFRSDLYKFVFIHIPKTGGTSIKKFLYGYANADQLLFDGEKVIDLNNWHPHEPLSYLDFVKYRDYLKFTFVRNPWARHASIWKFLTGRNDSHIKGLDFKEYIDAIVNNQLIYSRNQTYYFIDNGWILIDYVGRFENLEEDFKIITAKLNIPWQRLSHMKNQGNYDYRAMYTDQMRALISKHCESDIKQFNYEF